MFVIYCATPVYDNRDGFAGNKIARVGGYAYETSALALRKLPAAYDEDGAPEECHYFVADASDPWRRPVPRPACLVLDEFEDVPF